MQFFQQFPAESIPEITGNAQQQQPDWKNAVVGEQDKIKSDYPACGKDQEETGGELERFDIFPEFEKPILVFEFKRSQLGTLLNP